MSLATPWVPPSTPWQVVDPYITASEYRSAGTAVDTSALIPGGTDQQQTVALCRRIIQASQWANEICDQTLAATVDIETRDRNIVKSSGNIVIPLKYWPVLEVQGVSLGYTPASLAAVSDSSNFWMSGRKILTVPTSSYPGASLHSQVTYVNGWGNSILATSTTAGATSLHLDSTLGFYVGRTYTIYDSENGDENFTVTSVTANTNTIGTSVLLYDHTLPTAPDAISVSGMPPSVKNAVVELTSASIRTRGVLSLEMLSMGAQPRTEIGIEDGAMVNLQMAVDLLDDFRRVAP